MQALYRFCEAPGALQQVSQFFFQHLGVEQLLAVFPFVQCLGFIQSLIALQADQGNIKQGGGGFGQLGLAYTGRALHQHRLAQLESQEYCGGNLAAANITVSFKACLNLFD